MMQARQRMRRRAGVLGMALLAGGLGCVQTPVALELEASHDEEVEDVHIRAAAAAREAELARLSRPDEPERDYSIWPLSDDPARARFGDREVRSHPLWPTPISEPCPAVMFSSYDPELVGGDMFDRTTTRLAAVGNPRFGMSPTGVRLLRDHIEIPGLRLVAASHTSSACMMGWRHTHCLVAQDDVYCPDGTSKDLERLVRAQQLAPRSLDPAGWFELAVVMSGAESIVIEPRLVRECTQVEDASALAPAVEIDDERVTVRFTSVDRDGGRDHTVIIARDGTVTMEAQPRWQIPSDEDVWG